MSPEALRELADAIDCISAVSGTPADEIARGWAKVIVESAKNPFVRRVYARHAEALELDLAIERSLWGIAKPS